METPVISFNLRERGRVLTGIPRDFDVPRIVAAINSDECQERVRLRDCVGYYGHWARIKFGMNPAEGGVDGGKAVSVEPAVVTTFIEAEKDGTIHHKQEFLNVGTKGSAGKIAQQLHESRIGGFSFVIDNKSPSFKGADYVLNANFVTNRGYTLDSAFEAACAGGVCSLGMTRDDLDSAIYDEQLEGMQLILDSALTMDSMSLMALQQMQDELERLRTGEMEYLSIITKLKAEKARLEAVTMDSSTGKVPLMMRGSAGDRMLRAAHDFRAAKLLFPDSPDEHSRKPTPEMPAIYGKLLSRYSHV